MPGNEMLARDLVPAPSPMLPEERRGDRHLHAPRGVHLTTTAVVFAPDTGTLDAVGTARR